MNRNLEKVQAPRLSAAASQVCMYIQVRMYGTNCAVRCVKLEDCLAQSYSPWTSAHFHLMVVKDIISDGQAV